MSVLELKNVSYSYGSNSPKVLDSINYSFEKGKIYSIIGKSGAGKTTLLSLLSGLTKPTEGEILYNDSNISQINRYKYRSRMVGVVFQGYNLLPQLTASENVVLSLDVSGKKVSNKKKVAKEYLEKVNLDDKKAKRKVLKLSGGEQQRVAIARALSYNPDVILADEPTGNLDNETEKDIMQIFLDLAKKENKCVIIVTHSQKVASYSDEIVRLNSGKVEETANNIE